MNELKPLLPGMPELPSLYGRTGNIADINQMVMPLDQFRALQLATWKAAMEYAAQRCMRVATLSAVTYETGVACAAAIRQAPEPTADRGKEAAHG